ncbi:MAG: PH domain-containing protein [Knoellia sp.]
MTGDVASGQLMVRGPGYLALCVGVQLTLLLVSIGAFLDPALDGTGDPDWMFWIWVAVLAGLLLRAPLVGLRITDERVIRRGWLRTWTYPVAEVNKVRSRPYSGLLNGSISESRTFRMLRLKLVDGRVVDVPEVAGGSRSTQRRVADANTGLHRDQVGVERRPHTGPR